MKNRIILSVLALAIIFALLPTEITGLTVIISATLKTVCFIVALIVLATLPAKTTK
jgi:hypothetical protein